MVVCITNVILTNAAIGSVPRSCIPLYAMMMMVLQLVFMYMRWGRWCNWVNGSMLGLFPDDGLAAAGEVGGGKDDRSFASAPCCEGNPSGSVCVSGEDPAVTWLAAAGEVGGGQDDCSFASAHAARETPVGPRVLVVR